MDRFRWFRIRKHGGAITLQEMRRSLLSARAADSWFSAADDNNEYSFFRRTQILIPVLTSTGDAGARTVDTIVSTQFSIIFENSESYLRVLNPGRNLQSLMSGMERAVGRGFSVRPLTLEGGHPASILSQANVKRIVGVKLKNVVVSRDCVGRIELASKSGVDLGQVSLLKGLQYTIASIKYEVVVDGVRGAFSIADNGLVKVGGKLAPLIVSEIQKDIIRSSRAAV